MDAAGHAAGRRTGQSCSVPPETVVRPEYVLSLVRTATPVPLLVQSNVSTGQDDIRRGRPERHSRVLAVRVPRATHSSAGDLEGSDRSGERADVERASRNRVVSAGQRTA